MSRRLVENIKTGVKTEFKSIKEFGNFILPYLLKDEHDNWFYQNLSNMSQKEYTDTENKDDLIFEFNGYRIKKL